MDMHLVVVRPFGGLARGDVVTDPARIARNPRGRARRLRRACRCIRRPATRRGGLSHADRPAGQHQHDGAGGARSLRADRAAAEPGAQRRADERDRHGRHRGLGAGRPAGRSSARWRITRAISARSCRARYDMGTQVATAVQQGAQNFRCVRVTDGTDTAAQADPGFPANYALALTAALHRRAGQPARRGADAWQRRRHLAAHRLAARPRAGGVRQHRRHRRAASGQHSSAAVNTGIVHAARSLAALVADARRGELTRRSPRSPATLRVRYDGGDGAARRDRGDAWSAPTLRRAPACTRCAARVAASACWPTADDPTQWTDAGRVRPFRRAST